MNKRSLTLAGIFTLIVILAFALRDVVEAAVVIPIAYIWWLLKLYYAAFPQAIFWGLLAVISIYSAITNLIPKINPSAAPKIEVVPVRGRIEILADWIKKSERGMYYKWLVANRLGKNAREILAQREGSPISKSFGTLRGRGWKPPREIASYLENGLNSSFADFPSRRWSLRKQTPPPTPLDTKAQIVIDYLEDEMEMENGRDRKSI